MTDKIALPVVLMMTLLTTTALAQAPAESTQFDNRLASYQQLDTNSSLSSAATRLVSYCDDGCDGKCNSRCKSACRNNWRGGAEAVFLKDYGSDGYYSEHSAVGYRLFLEYQWSNGLAITARHFNYDNGDDSNYGNELMYVDLELSNRFEIGKTQIAVAGGYRHADVRLADDYTVLNNLNGVTLGVQGERELLGGLNAFLWIQESFLFGRDNYGGYPGSHMNWAETQLGLRYATKLAGRNAWFRGGVEAHDLRAAFDGYAYPSAGEFGFFIGGGVSF